MKKNACFLAVSISLFSALAPALRAEPVEASAYAEWVAAEFDMLKGVRDRVEAGELPAPGAFCRAPGQDGLGFCRVHSGQGTAQYYFWFTSRESDSLGFHFRLFVMPRPDHNYAFTYDAVPLAAENAWSLNRVYESADASPAVDIIVMPGAVIHQAAAQGAPEPHPYVQEVFEQLRRFSEQ